MNFAQNKPEKSLPQKKKELVSKIRLEIGFAVLFLCIFCFDNFENISQNRLNELTDIYLLIFGGGMLLSAVYFSFQHRKVKTKLKVQGIKNAKG